MCSLILYLLVALLGVAAREPRSGRLPGSDFLPRKSVQWPRPKSGYVPRATDHLCLASYLEPLGALTQASSPVIGIAFDELQYMLRSAKQTEDCLKATADGAATPGKKFIDKLRVNITGAEAGRNELGPNVDESYTLNVAESGIVITAPTVYGARHAFMTLINMLEVRNFSPPATNYYANRIPYGDRWHWILPYREFTITDEPRLSHRGVMIDTARHYQDWEDLYLVVDGLSRAKMNVFHWHATDDQSFPLVLDKSRETIHGPECERENLEGKCHGAYNSYMTYHQEDVETFIDYANMRGVRVIIEIDQPSHARSWANLNTKLRDCDTIDHQVEGYCVQPICGPLNLLGEYDAVRSLADAILEDWMKLTPNEIVHIGMDEIGADCWTEKTRDELSAKWLADSVESVQKINKNADVMVWQDGLVFPTGVKVPEIASKVMAQVWNRAEDAKKYLEEGRDIVWSSYEGMYLDCGRGNTAIPTFNSWCGLYKTWWDVYKQTPDLTIDYDKNKAGVGKVRGGETPLWAEQADTSNLHTLLWPRVAAWGGASWEARTEAPKDPSSTEEAEPILFAQHQLAAFSNMMAQEQGIRHTPMFVQWCIFENEEMCDRFTDSFYTPPGGNSGAAAKITQLAVGGILLAAFNV